VIDQQLNDPKAKDVYPIGKNKAQFAEISRKTKSLKGLKAIREEGLKS
jgi:hypothetical protein